MGCNQAAAIQQRRSGKASPNPLFLWFPAKCFKTAVTLWVLACLICFALGVSGACLVGMDEPLIDAD
jgi:hypothetical protein